MNLCVLQFVLCAHRFDAEAAFLHALELDPSGDAALFNLAVLYGNNGMEDDMRSTLQQLLQVREFRWKPLSPCSALTPFFVQINPHHSGARAMAMRLSH